MEISRTKYSLSELMACGSNKYIQRSLRKECQHLIIYNTMLHQIPLLVLPKCPDVNGQLPQNIFTFNKKHLQNVQYLVLLRLYSASFLDIQTCIKLNKWS